MLNAAWDVTFWWWAKRDNPPGVFVGGDGPRAFAPGYLGCSVSNLTDAPITITEISFGGGARKPVPWQAEVPPGAVERPLRTPVHDLFGLVQHGTVAWRDAEGGWNGGRFTVDRRRPRNCIIVLQVTPDGLRASPCEPVSPAELGRSG